MDQGKSLSPRRNPAEATTSSVRAEATAPSTHSLPILRSGLGGILMGLANLVPGVSGGTMIVVMGLYEEFIHSVADVTRLRFTKRNLSFLLLLLGVAGVTIAFLSGAFVRVVTLHRSAMFSLFIGMTLGGAPVLLSMTERVKRSTVMAIVMGLTLMVVIAMTTEEPPDREVLRQAVAQGRFVIEPDYGRDLTAGLLGMSAMVLPGISGAYMLLVLGRYETIFAAIDAAKGFAVSWGGQGDPAVFLSVILPTAIGSLLSVVCLSNALKWMLHHHRDVSVGFLLGILAGSVVGIWPFDAGSEAGDYLIGGMLAMVGFAATLLLSRISA